MCDGIYYLLYYRFHLPYRTIFTPPTSSLCGDVHISSCDKDPILTHWKVHEESKNEMSN